MRELQNSANGNVPSKVDLSTKARNLAINFAVIVVSWVVLGVLVAATANISIVEWLGLDRMSAAQGMFFLAFVALIALVFRFILPSPKVNQFPMVALPFFDPSAFDEDQETEDES